MPKSQSFPLIKPFPTLMDIDTLASSDDVFLILPKTIQPHQLIYVSEDGASWTLTALPFSATWLKPHFYDDAFFITCLEKPKAIYKSINGKAWTCL